MITATALAKTVFLVVLGCNGTPGTDETCDSSFNAESWAAPTYAVAKQECETFLREEFDPSDYLDMTKFDFAAVQCE